MHFELTTPRALGPELAKIFERNIEATRRTLESRDTPVDKRVHEARKLLKRLRALVRAVKGRMSRGQAEKLNAALRDTARTLSGLREAAAAVAAFPRLADAQKLEPDLRQKVYQELERLRSSAYSANDPAELVEAALATLRPAHEVLEQLDWETCDWHDLSQDLTGTYRKARTLLAKAKASGQSEDAHALRKVVKYHWHHLELIRGTWPTVFDVFIEATHALADLLGDDHDLADLERMLEVGGIGLESSEAVLLRKAIRQEMESLRLRAFSIAERLFAEPPPAWKVRIQAYYESWRAEAEPGN